MTIDIYDSEKTLLLNGKTICSILSENRESRVSIILLKEKSSSELLVLQYDLYSLEIQEFWNPNATLWNKKSNNTEILSLMNFESSSILNLEGSIFKESLHFQVRLYDYSQLKEFFFTHFSRMRIFSFFTKTHNFRFNSFFYIRISMHRRKLLFIS